MEVYKSTGPVDCAVGVDTSVLRGRTAIVTGGANGIGEAYVRALYAVGVHVWLADLDDTRGQSLARELPGCTYIRCDISSWVDQVKLFKVASTDSPTGSIHYVIANAGIAPRDEVFSFEKNGPVEPSLKAVDVNLKGVLYTTKLSMHYFIKQNGTSASHNAEDTSLILIGSGAAFLDVPRGPIYPSTKFAVRGIMHSLRRTTHYYTSRVNVINPWYVRTSILSPEIFDEVKSKGVDFADASDAAACVLKILSDASINGHSFFIAPRKWADEGYIDLGLDEYTEDTELLREVQKMQMASKPPEDGLF